MKTSPIKNAPRRILCQLNDGPVAMQLDQPAAIDGPQQTGAGTVENLLFSESNCPEALSGRHADELRD
jgi:hypothetical protein